MRTRYLLALAVIGSVVSGTSIWYALKQRHQLESVATYDFDPALCPGVEREWENQDVYMRGQVEQGEKVKAVTNWYRCNKPERGDLVLYRYSMHAVPVIKRIVGLPGDKVELVTDAKMNAWNLKVNGILIEMDGRPYFFGVANVLPPLGLHLKAHGGALADKTALILSGFPPGNLDSGTVGPVALEDLVAKVEKYENTELRAPASVGH